MSRRKGLGRVVIIGGGMSGLLTAVALADRADRITIIDRDRMPEQAEHRPGVPQGRHIHVLLASGQRSIEALLPGVLAELDGLGVPAVGSPRDVVQLSAGRWVNRDVGELSFLTGTRPLLEQVVRRRVQANPRIDAVDGVEALGFVGDKGTVRGVRVRRRIGNTLAEQEELAADLVVDATGRSSHTPQWLTELGAELPAEERIDSGLCYTTRLYHGPVHPGYKGIYLIPRPEATRGAVIMPTEVPGQFLVTLSGLAGDEPPTDPKEFEAYAKSLPHPIVYDWMMAAQPQGTPMGFRGTANVRRRYEKLGGRPRGLLVVGDAACAFNPVYGQGMTVAAVAAVALRDSLARGTRDTRHLQQIVSQAALPAWTISSGSDKNMPGATGNAVSPGPADRFADWYLGRVQAHAATHPVIGERFQDVLHLVAPPTALFAWPVMRTVLFGRLAPAAAEPPIYVDGARSTAPGVR